MLRLVPYYAGVLGWTGCLTLVLVPGGLVAMLLMVAADEPRSAAVAVLVGVGFTAAMVGWLLWRLMPAAEGLRLATVGSPARARIDALEETGVTVGTSLLVRFRLTVSPGGGQPYAATCTDLVPRLAIGQFRPGDEIDVMVDPGDRLRLTVRPPAAASGG